MSRAARDELDAIISWIGRPDGRGRILPLSPCLNVEREVQIWDANARLSTRRIRIKKLLGSGLAGTVYLAEDSEGRIFIEKHYGEIPCDGSKKIGRFLTALIFSLFRQAPLSFREIPEAVITSHLANCFVVEASRTRFGNALTPPILYTRYDPQTGGYVQAFTFVEGRPLRPWDYGLPLLGEAEYFFPKMQRWRDFLANELGFWGLARQVDPANPNSFSNVWVTPDSHVLLLDIVPGVPGFLEARYLWWGLVRGHFPPFGDAIDFHRLRHHLQRHPLQPMDEWQKRLTLLETAVEHWQNSEPRLCSSWRRPMRVLRDPDVRCLTRRATITHLEVKGAISSDQANEFREELARTGRFPRLLRHTLLKMAPLSLHLLFTDGLYLRRVLSQSWRWPLLWTKTFLRFTGKAALRVLRTLGAAGKLLFNREARMQACLEKVGGWIDEEYALGRMTERQRQRLRRALEKDSEIADLLNVFATHLAIGSIGSTVGGPSGSLLIGTALVTHDWRFAIPATVEPLLRMIAVIHAGLGSRVGLLLFSALPTIGIMAAPLYLLRKRPELGGFMLRSFGRKAALHVPGFGERGSLCEMLGQAFAQIFIVDPAPVLPPALVAVMAGLILRRGHCLIIAAALLYFITVLITFATRRREGKKDRVFHRVEPHELDRLPVGPWQFGMPES